MSMSLSFRMGMQMSMKMKLTLPSINWSLLDAYKEEGDEPLRFRKTRLDVSGLPLEDRLAAVDRANEIFRFAYTQAENDAGKPGRYYKVPLLRNFNIDIEDINIPISKPEYA